MAISSKQSTPMLMVLLAGIVGYIAYTGSVVDSIGIQGLSARQDQVRSVRRGGFPIAAMRFLSAAGGRSSAMSARRNNAASP